MCSAENYSVVGPCTPNFRRLRRGRCRPRRPLFLIWHGFLPTDWDFESILRRRTRAHATATEPQPANQPTEKADLNRQVEKHGTNGKP